MQALGKIMVVAAGAMMGFAAAKAIAFDPKNFLGVAGYALSIAAGMALMTGFMHVMSETMVPPEMDDYTPIDLSGIEPAGIDAYSAPMLDSGGTFAPTNEHGLAILQKGERVIPKTQTGGQGVVINVHGDVYDGDMFAQKMSLELANALRMANDTGGI
jgi:hypothetical protein